MQRIPPSRAISPACCGEPPRAWPAAPAEPSAAGHTPAQRALLVLLRGYKLAFSPWFAGSCRFVPSCSDYAAEAVATHGALRGMGLAARRLARCHPLGSHGLDPVPPRAPRES